MDPVVAIALVVGVSLAWPSAPGWSGAHAGLALAALATGAAALSAVARRRAWLLLGGLGGLLALTAIERPYEPELVLGAGISAGWTWARATGLFARASSGSRGSLPLAVAVGSALLLGAARETPGRGLAIAALVAVGLAAWARPAGPHEGPQGHRGGLLALVATPARFIVVSFAAIAAVGTFALALPPASASGGGVGLLDAAFTSVSATCVTGLAVLDTPNELSLFGQVVLLALIQVGGLGIMTFAAGSAVLVGRRLGVHEEAFAADMLGGGGVRRDLDLAVRRVIEVTVITEAIAAVLLTGLFLLDGDALPQAAWRGLFTAVSAFCNAGFALQSDSLVSYHDDPLVLLVIGVTIVVGGLGPLTVVALPALARGRGTLQTKLVCATSAVLLAGPAVAWLALEWSNTLGGMSVVDKVANAGFQAVTLRTAGFNSVDFGAIHPATWTLSILCMFVGGSPGSTAGGVKTTTLAVLWLAVVAAVRGREEAEAFRRRLPHRVIYQATAIATAGVLLAVVALVALQLTQPIAVDRGLFEVVSALGTVGLSMGATAELDGVGKILIMGCMFIGRVGPLTLFVLLAERDAGRANVRPALESVHLG